jgi:hypothetical protein
VFDARYLEKLLARHQRGRELDLQIWTLLCFELWCRRFLDGGHGAQRLEPEQEAAAV